MRHQVDGRKFGRNTSHRVAMFRTMANQVIAEERIVTTVQKAKEVRRVVDRLITLAKKGSAAARRMAFDRTRDQVVVEKLFSELAGRFSKRAGGYTRVVKLVDRRWGDSAEMAAIELVDHPEIVRGKAAKKAAPQAAKTEQAAAPVAADSFSKMRKAFTPKRAAKAGTEAAPKAAAKKAAPKVEKKPAAKKSAKPAT